MSARTPSRSKPIRRDTRLRAAQAVTLAPAIRDRKTVPQSRVLMLHQDGITPVLLDVEAEPGVTTEVISDTRTDDLDVVDTTRIGDQRCGAVLVRELMQTGKHRDIDRPEQ